MTVRKRIVVLTSTFPRWQGDIEPPFVFELCQRLTDRFDLLVIAPHAEGALRHEWMGNIEVVRYRYFFPPWEGLAYQGGILAKLKQNRLRYFLLPFFFISQAFSLWCILRCRRIDAIHAHWIIPQGMVVAFVGLFVKNMPPILCTSHGGDLLGLNGWLPGIMKRWAIRRASMLTVVSHAMLDCALSQDARPDRVQVISMGVDTAVRFTPDASIDRADNEILFVGRLVEKKGCSYLLEAMPEILRRFPSAHLNIVGDGPLKEDLKQLAGLLKIEQAVTFLGVWSNADLPRLYRHATVLVAPSIITSQGDQEGLGLVLVEALACGCPVIASDLPAIRDVVVEGISGLRCEPMDSSGLAEKISFLLHCPEHRVRLGDAGRRFVAERFGWQIVAQRYGQLLEELAPHG